MRATLDRHVAQVDPGVDVPVGEHLGATRVGDVVVGPVHEQYGHPPARLVHGTSDRITDPRRTEVLAERYTASGVDLRYVKVEGGTHSMLKDAALWHDTVADFVTDVLLGPGQTS